MADGSVVNSVILCTPGDVRSELTPSSCTVTKSFVGSFPTAKEGNFKGSVSFFNTSSFDTG